jgi:hypothetical protein
MVKPLAFVCRHLALLALCHLFSRQAKRKSDILYTYSWVEGAEKLAGVLGRRASLAQDRALLSPGHTVLYP